MSEKQADFIKDPATYRAMSEPLADANEAIRAFNVELRELRAKYRLRDVACIVSGCYSGTDGSEVDYILDMYHGDDMKRESLLAWAFGKASAERQEMISRFSQQFLKQPRKRK